MAKEKELLHDQKGKIIVEDEQILDGDIGDYCTDWVCLHATNKNLYRVMPSMIDGLKPVHRRILYTMYQCGCMTKLKKVLKICGLVSDIHPHADTSDTLGKMGQTFSNNIPLILGNGNFGSISGDDVGSARYIEAMLSDFSKKAYFKDFDLNSVDTRPTYTMESEEPEFLPARYPIALLNGMQSSIGTAYCSNIPPYNFTELCNQTIDLIKDPKAPVYLVPDLPTGAAIVDDGKFDEISEKGKGTFIAQATYEIDHESNAIHFRTIPIQMSVNKIIEGITEMKTKHQLEEVKDVANLTSEHNKKIKENQVDLVIHVVPDANPEKVVEKLFKSGVGLRKSYAVELIMIDDFKMKFYSIRTFLLEWIQWRRDYLRSYYNNHLVLAMEAKHMNDICLNIFNGKNIERTASMAKNAQNTSEFAKALMDTYGMTSLQAHTISNMKYSAFTKDAYQGYVDKGNELGLTIEKYRTMLSKDQLIDDEIIDQLNDGIKCFGYPRRSPILTGDKVIENTKHVIAISKDGYIKKIGIDKNIGTVGDGSDKNYTVLAVANKSTILVFDSLGYVAPIPVSSIPSSRATSNGYPLSRYCEQIGHVVHIMEQSPLSEIKKLGLELIFVTELGYAKRTSFKSVGRINKYQSVISLNDGDRLMSVVPSSSKIPLDLLIYTNRGKGIRLHTDEINSVGKNAKGVVHINLDKKEGVSGATLIDSEMEYLVYVTMSGKMKLTEIKYLPASKRRGESLPLIDIDTRDRLIGIASAMNEDKVIVYRKNSDAEEIAIKSLPVSTRVAKATKVVKTMKGDCVLDFTVSR